MTQIIGIIVAFVLGVLGGGTAGVLSQGIHIANDQRQTATQTQTTIQDVGQVTIVDGIPRGCRMVVTNINGNLSDVLRSLKEYQRVHASFSRDTDGWVLVYPEMIAIGKTNFTQETITASNKISTTNRTNY
jgi:hypothetical protein